VSGEALFFDAPKQASGKTKNKNMKIQPVNEVLSLFSVGLKQYASVSQNTRQVAVSLTGAFLVVMAAGFALNIASAAIDATSGPQKSEPVAYQPGRYIASHTSGGYIGFNQ